MIYLKAMIIFNQEALPLAASKNTDNSTTCHTSLKWKITVHGIMNLQIKTGKIFGHSASAKKNQYQYNKFSKPSQVSNSQENATGCMSSPPPEKRKSSETIFNKIYAY